MNRLSDRRRETVLVTLATGLGVRDTSRVLGPSKVTIAQLIRDFHRVVERAGVRLAPQFRDLDQFRTTAKRYPLDGRLRAPVPIMTPRELLVTRAIIAQAQHDARSQSLFDSALPLIRSVYAPRTRAQILDAEARAEGAFAPLDCRHCGGSYGWRRHEEICVRFGLVA